MDIDNNNLNTVSLFFFWQNEHHKDIRSVLGVKRMTCKTKNELQNAHRNFVMNLEINISRFSKTRAKLDKIYKKLRKYEDIDSITEQVLILALPHTRKNPLFLTGFLLLWTLLDSVLVEAAGIEPASENLPLELLRA